jgi:hypothetical protein
VAQPSATARANRSELTQRPLAIAASTAPTDLLAITPGQPSRIEPGEHVSFHGELLPAVKAGIRSNG